MVKFYDDAGFFFKVYIIIGRHTYRDMTALQGVTGNVCIKTFHTSVLVIHSSYRKTQNEFYITMIIIVCLHKII